MNFTKLDLPDKIDALMKKCKGYVEQLDDPQKRNQMVSKTMELANAELDRQMKIYVKEEKEYIAAVEQLQGMVQTFAREQRDIVKQLQKNWDDTQYNKLVEINKRLPKAVVTINNLGNKLTAHQGVRGAICSDDNIVKAAVSANNFKILNNRYKKLRQPMIDAIAKVRIKINKLDAYAERGESCLKAANSLKRDYVKNIDALKREMTQRGTELQGALVNLGSLNTSKDRMETFIGYAKKTSTYPSSRDMGGVHANNHKKFELDYKKSKLELKTIDVRFENTKVRAKGVKDKDLVKSVKANEKTIKKMHKDFDAFEKVYKKYQPAYKKVKAAVK